MKFGRLSVLLALLSGCAFHVVETRIPGGASSAILVAEDMGPVQVIPDRPGFPEGNLDSKGRTAAMTVWPGSYVVRFPGGRHAVIVRAGEVVWLRLRPFSFGDYVSEFFGGLLRVPLDVVIIGALTRR